MSNTLQQEKNMTSKLIFFTDGDLDVFEKETRVNYDKVAIICSNVPDDFYDMLWDCKEKGLIDILILLDDDYGQEAAVKYLKEIMGSDNLYIVHEATMVKT